MRLLSTLLVVCLVLKLAAAAKDAKGWGGLPERLLDSAMVMHHEADKQFEEDATPWVQQVGLHPRAYYFHNFLTKAERAHLVRVAAPKLKRSTVVGGKGEGVVDDIRTSYGMFIRRLSDPVVTRIEKRISLWTHLPVEHQEDIQILRYAHGQTYGAHYDSGASSDHVGPKWRLATFLMYLSDVEEGGETAFPHNSVWADPSIPEQVGDKFSDCAKGHVAAKPKAGDAVLFYSFYPNNTMDPASMHTGCPVIKGVKWAAPVWMHDIPFRPEEISGMTQHNMDRDPDAGTCTDLHARCTEWAAAGECENNKAYMCGGSNNLGACRKSCKVCESCRSGDMECINRNRVRGGYWKLDKDELEWLGAGDLWKADMSPEL
ncbi:hypothetical protein CHLRE_02g084450v5 [Chlamydomonas reinhardtii]|uniref:Fe2OG dioxygenase domain-containing protein n=1 Tax=Chlamydomonas reinhardtii TaxID=3055 RepID=A0A2K3E0R9_CHLRE|nr:uncharacterized protein CHLRE_02g084450v5 [Chlamydomonas reinhardtii]PNW86388.1 hypothetical protein CHLRE_02g084450v5 [Chlamydomonas reinhardtii]